MATFFVSASVLATPSGKLPVSQQYLFVPQNVNIVTPATTTQKASYPTANSVISYCRPLNNSHETVEYIVAETASQLNT